MKITCLNSTILFSCPIINTNQRQKPHLCCCLPNITRPLKVTNFPLQPKKCIKNPPISYPKKDNIYQNTCSDVIRLIDGLGLVVTPDIYACLVAECTQKKNAFQASLLFAHIKRNHRMVSFLNRPSGSLFVDRILLMLVACGCLEDAHQLFDKMPQRDSLCLTIMISGFVSNQLSEQALKLFVKMYRCLFHLFSGVMMEVALVCVLEACAHLNDVTLGKVVHGLLVKMGCGGDLVGVALVQFYGKFRCLEESNFLFYEEIRVASHCDRSLWTNAIMNNFRGGWFEEVVRIFVEMRKVGLGKDEYVLSSVLEACGRLSDDGSYGRQVHAYAIKVEHDRRDSVTCGLIGMYGRFGLVNDAKKAFNMVGQDKRSKACWNAMASGYTQNGLSIEAIKLLYQMKAVGLQPEESLIVELRMACGSQKYGMD